MSILAIDWGTKHVGLAISYSGVYAKELTVLPNTANLIGELGHLIKDHHVETMVVGLPKNYDGSEAAIAKDVKKFARKLKEHLRLPVHFEDEHLTSKEAARLLSGKVAPDDERIDSYSAKLILEQFLAHKDNEP